MSFMKPQIVYGGWYTLDGSNGTEHIPSNLANVSSLRIGEILLVSDAVAHLNYCDLEECEKCNQTEEIYELLEYSSLYSSKDHIESVSLRCGFGARLSAPGYLDCTDWVVFDTKEEARDYLRDEYCECDMDNNNGLCELCQSLMDMD